MQNALIVDSLFLVALRSVFFLLSRRFLLDTLHPKLRDISADDVLPLKSHFHHVDDDGDTDDAASAASSYPGSPAPRPVVLNKNHLQVDEEIGVELESLGQRLREVGHDARRQVLHLSHGHAPSTAKATVKKTARGLSRAARIMFSLVVAEACNLLTLVMLHSIGVLHSLSRHANFSLSLHVLLGMILLVIPLEQCLLLTYRTRTNDTTSQSTVSTTPLASRLLISLIPFGLYIFLFTRIPPYVTAVESDRSADSENWESGGWLTSSLGRVIVLGTVVLGALSGFGAVRTAWDFIEHLQGARKRPVTDSEILQVERSLFHTRQEIIIKQREAPQQSTTWSGRFFGVGGQDAAELRALQAIEARAANSLRTLKMRKRQQEFGRSLAGQIYRFIGYAFALYCAARVLMCLPSLMWSTSLVPLEGEKTGKGNTNGDWISFLLAVAIAQLPSNSIDVGVSARIISIILTGILILSSLSQVLRSLTRLLHLTSKTIGSGFLLLSLAQLFATYVISLLVQLRNFMPSLPSAGVEPVVLSLANSTMVNDNPPPVLTDTPLLASLPDFRVFGRLFDITFLLAAVFTAAYRYVSSRLDADDIHNF